MGAVYDVILKLKYNKKDEEKLISTLKTYIDETLGIYIEQERICLDTLVDEILANCSEKEEYEDCVIYSSGFDASYSWESFMMEAFEAIAPHLKYGSIMKIWPDNGWECGHVKKGEAWWTYSEE